MCWSLMAIIFIVLVSISLAFARPDKGLDGLIHMAESQRSSPSVQEAAVKGVLQRLLPSHSSSFEFRVISKDLCGGVSCFWIKNFNNSGVIGSPEMLIEGATAVEIAAGLHWYIKYWCGAHVSWDKTGGTQIVSIPDPGLLPRVQGNGVMVQRPVPWSYYQNVVTSSYSYVWWDWERWEKEIDWMALQGVNLPLAFTGQESVWQKVFKGFNISKEELDDFFGGPAFLAWARMGNLHGWGGPLPQSWLDEQLALQKCILSRMLELGMTPVLPSFSGNVPAALKKRFPAANITRLGDWNTVNGDTRWCCTFLLDPSDPLFIEIGQAFIQQQFKEYGVVTHIYNCDTFNENSPPTDDPTYISSLGAGVYEAMHKGDRHAVWLMQGWLFSSDSSFWKPPQMKALLHSVPYGKMIVLDLFADVNPIWKRSSHFYGTPYIWCMLHNFGGNIEMYGTFDTVSAGPIDAHVSPNSTMIGVGMCMEGIEQNPVVYEQMSEMAFWNEKVKVEEWVRNYSHRRYGKRIKQIEAAWDILYHTIYNCTDGIADHNNDYIVELPDFVPTLKSNTQNAIGGQMIKASSSERIRRFSFRETSSDLPRPHLWYSPGKVIHALKLFLDAGDLLIGSLTYRYDLVDLTRQVLSKLANQVYVDALTAYHSKHVEELNVQSQKFIELIKDIDMLLASEDGFLLGPWLESAKNLARSPGQLRQYEWNARTQVTMWYDNTNTNQSKLHDYANKFWSSLLRSYYLPRASTYFDHLLKSLRENQSFPLEKWRREWISYSNNWQSGTELYSVKAQGDAFKISKDLFKKYLEP
ncbi:alpha-N-acetylglucosaminidase isoform X3 [Amborella trichopoda]|nr:alpha-N-acetylglucosaminidase isoform X3 [Amborella trichopoda]|eukprot:XP_006851078.2 alpha-N-acetylglucosaminidase isoform X3 [Amborella trichopoda]